MNVSATAIPFVKASACGNDFLIIDGIHAPADLAAFSRRICERHEGVGADGVEWLFPAQDADVQARLFNADGSEAEISGNGTRCVAAHICSEQGKEKIVIRTGAGLKVCNFMSRSDTQYEFEIAMGEPEVGDEFPIKLAAREVRGIPVSMGNPHYVIFVKEFAPGWQVEASEIGRNPAFKYGINVELVTAMDKREYRGQVLRAWSRRNSILRNRFMRRCSRCHRGSKGRVPATSACARRRADGPMGAARCFFEAQPNSSVAANFSFNARMPT